MKMEYIEHKINGNTLRGMVHLPSKEVPKNGFPAVLMFHGFAATRDEYFLSFVRFAELLAARGTAVFRFDFSAHGESDGNFFDFTFTNELTEGEHLVDFVGNLHYVDATKISLLGMSLGGVTAAMVAGNIPDKIASICLWSPALVFTHEILNEGTLQGKSVDMVEKYGYFDFHSLKLGPNFFTELPQLDVYKKATQYKGKVKIIHGTEDIIAPIQYSKKLIDLYEQPAELHSVARADHSWGDVRTREELFDETIAFFYPYP